MTTNKKDFMDKVKAIIVGHAVADALGVPVEFMSREELKANPVKDMQGHGTYPVPKGAWSDDTSMSLCALSALTSGTLDMRKVMNNFSHWYFNDAFTPTGEMFDVGNTCSIAIERYEKENKPWFECGLTDENSNGNGSLMRINPFVLYAYTLDLGITTKVDIIEMASSLTHAHPRSKLACGIYAFIMWELMSATKCFDIKPFVRQGLIKARKYYHNHPEFNHFAKLYHQIVDVDGLSKIKPQLSTSPQLATEDDIVSDGYVVNSLEAAIWCLINTGSYKSCVLKAVNLGDDTDTTAAIAGSLAAAAYGYEDIPKSWLETLIKRDQIEDLCKGAYAWVANK